MIYRHLSFRWVGCVIALFCLIALPVSADNTDPKSALRAQFEPIIFNVSKQLLAHQAHYKKDPVAFQGFLDQYVSLHWDAGSTARALVGSDNFKRLSAKNKRSLISAVDKTLKRYACEAVVFYSGQQFILVDVSVSDSGKMGWVQVVMRSQILPDLNLDILVKRNKTGIWKAVDVRFKGITYVAVKKHGFQKIMQKQGADALITSLDVKNNDFFDALKPKK